MLEGNSRFLEESYGLGDDVLAREVEGEMELPGVRDGEVSGGVCKCEADLDESCFLDVVPEELILDIFGRMVERQVMLLDGVPGKFGVLSGKGRTRETTL